VVLTEAAGTETSSVSFTWQITNRYRPPSAAADSFAAVEDTTLAVAAGGVLDNDAGPDGDALSAVLQSGPAHGQLTLNVDGSFTYVPPANFNGSDSFSYRVNDGVSESEPTTVSIVVASVNDTPSFVPGPSALVNEDAGAQSIAGWATQISAGPANESAQVVTFHVASNSNAALFAVPPAVSPSGTLTYQPAADAFGSATITVYARDNGGTANGGDDTSDPVTFTISVTSVPDAPRVAPDSYAVTGGQLLAVSAPGVLANDTHPDGSALTAVLVSGPSSGSLTLQPNGAFTFTAPTGITSPTAVTFSYAASDGMLTSAPVTVTFTVTPSNLPPVCTAATVSPAIIWPPNHKPVYVTIRGVTDPENRPLTIRVTSILQDEPTNSAGDGNTRQDAGIENNGARAWVRAERSGTGDGRVYLIAFTASDGAASCSGVVQVAVPHDRQPPAVLSPPRWNSVTGALVTPPPAPNAVDDTLLVRAGRQKLVAVLDNDNVFGVDVSLTIVMQPAKGTAKVSHGKIVYKAPANGTGTTTLTYKISNAFGGSDTATVKITIVPRTHHDDDDDCGDDRHDHWDDRDGRDDDHYNGNHARCKHRR
jgi:hypothetical protein